MKIYIVSGLGADYKVLEKLKFPEQLEVVVLDWLIPEQAEPFDHYIERMAAVIDSSEPFYLLGYSFGGIIVQEIHKVKQAEKVVILGSIKSHKEKSRFIKFGEVSKLPRFIPHRLFNVNSILMYSIAKCYAIWSVDW